MQFKLIAAGIAALASSASAADTDIFQFALSLEYFEQAFYQKVTSKFSEADFVAAGFSKDVYENLQTVLGDETAHVNALKAAITAGNVTAVSACNYDFTPAITSVATAVATAAALEEVGVKAYSGAVTLLTSASTSTAAVIDTIEARHAAYLEKINKNRFTLGPFDTPLGYRSIASAVNQTCLITNFAQCQPLGSIATYAAINVTSAVPAAANATITLTSTATGATTCLYAMGVATPTAPYVDGKCVLPDTKGYTQITVWLANAATAYSSAQDITGGTLTSIVAGPAFVTLNDGFMYNGGADNTNAVLGGGSVSSASAKAGVAALAAFGVAAVAVLAL